MARKAKKSIMTASNRYESLNDGGESQDNRKHQREIESGDEQEAYDVQEIPSENRVTFDRKAGAGS